ncbi:MAG TPA: DUF523 domain-containing protein [Candidatus Cloacimonetes bacterium]|nr:DUF523 domain-containing protein [Candidatus Cloacimonadota bacterium]
MIIVSACLAGINCRYDGENNFHPKIIKLVEEGNAIPVCPEQLGGLSTPRIPAEIIGDKILNENGEDVTEFFLRGALETLKIAKLVSCQKAIFKSNSPSCGSGKIYDGTFSGKLTDGKGICTRILEKHNIRVITENDI